MHPLEVILQLQLGSDQAAILHLPSVISSLSSPHFEPSPHLQKWISRIVSLIHSKHPGARWAGLCLALRTSTLSKDLMLESAQTWIAIALPMLSRNEAPPTSKACIRLLEYIFSSAVGMPEFQRQLATPNVPKFSAALITLAEKNDNRDISHISQMTLSRLIPLYPTLHRSLHPSLFSLSLRLLSGSSTSPTSVQIVDDACNLHASLHFTGGKVGAAALWRKSLDTALANAWSAFTALRATFPPLPRSTLGVQSTLDAVPLDPIIAIPLSLDRLKCSISLINALLKAVTARHVTVPVGELNKLALRLLRCTLDEADDSHLDPTRRALEISVIPDIWKLGCELVSQLARGVRHHLNPHLSRVLSHITHHLEQPLPKSYAVLFLRVLPPLLIHTYAPHFSISPTRLVKALLPKLTTLLSSKSDAHQELQDASTTTSKKGKKRAFGYEGDGVFNVGRGILCPAREDGEVVEATLDAMDPLLSNPHLSTPVRTIGARLLVTLLLELPRHSPSALSPDISLHGRIHAKVLTLCNKHALAGASGWVNSAVGLVVSAVGGASDGSETILKATGEAQRELELLLHPRLPPLLRSLPPIEAVSLFRSERAKDDKAAKDVLDVSTMEDVQPTGTSKATTITTTSTVTTEQVVPVSSTASVPWQPWSVATPSASALNSTPPVTVSQSTVAAQPATPLPTFTTPLIATAKDLMPVQQEVAIASTSSGVCIAAKYQESEEEDEQMPEIDMGSDTD